MAAADLRADLEARLAGEVRFDAVSRALYSTDASVYSIAPLGVAVVRSRADILAAIECARAHGCSITARGGGTSQAGQAIGPGLQVDTSKHFNRLLEVNVEERWARVEPGIVLDELNAHLAPQGLRFAPDISTASRATIGGMISNNSSGARSVLYGKTIDHVLDLHVALADGAVAHLRPLGAAELEAACARPTLEGECYRTVRRLAAQHAPEIDRRYPKILRRVGGYNLDAFVPPAGDRDAAFNLAKLMVGAEGTLGLIVEARLNLVPLPAARAVLTIEYDDLLAALGDTPALLAHEPSAVEVMDRSILDHARENPALDAMRRAVLQTDCAALLCVELCGASPAALAPRLERLEDAVRALGRATCTARATATADQARIWKLRESALGLSMAMKGDAKSISFVEDTAVAPEKLRDFIARFLDVVRGHGTTAGVYAHASVGCLHVRPVVNLKTAAGVRQFESIASDVADLVLEFGGALSGEHGDGLVRGPFMERMFGRELYEAFRTIKRTFDPAGLFKPRQDCRRAAAQRKPPLRSGLPDPGSARGVRLRGVRWPGPGRGDVQRRRRLPQDPGRHHVPLVHGDARRGALHAGPRQRLASAAGRRPARRCRRPGRPRRPRRARPVSRVPCLQDGVPGRCGHGAFQERIPRRLLATPRRAAARAAAGACSGRLALGRPCGAAAQSPAGDRAGPVAGRTGAGHRPPPFHAAVGARHPSVDVARSAHAIHRSGRGATRFRAVQ